MGPVATQNESALVCAAQRGDREAVRLLLTRNWNWLKALAYSSVGDSQDVDDVLQDICVRVISKIETLREPERFRPWLAILAQRQALRHRRQKSQRPLGLDEEIVERRRDYKAERFVENIEQKEQCEQIMAAIKSLPAKYREVLMLQYSSDLTYGQIAQVLDVPVTTVQIRLVRARRMIYNTITGQNKSKVTER